MEVPEEDLRENNSFFSGNLSSVVTVRWYQGLEKAAEKGFITENIRDVEKVINRGDEWDKLTAPFASPLLDSDWFIAGAKAFCPPNNLAVIVLKSGRKLKAIAPFNIKGALFPHLELIGSSTLREPGGLIYDSQKSLEALVKVMLDANKSLLLKRFYKSSAEVSVLERELKKRALVYKTEEDKIPYVDTSGDWKTFEWEKLSSSRRSSFRRLKRKAEKKGAVSFKTVLPNEENIDEYLEEVYRIEGDNWKGRMGTALKTHPTLSKFFKDYSIRMTREGKLRLFFLKVGEDVVAVQLTVVHSNSLWIYKIGYAEEWSWCSPGILLMHNVVRFCFENDLDSCEFLGSDEQWLHIWANGFHELITYSIYPKSATGLFVRFWEYLGTFYHKLRAKMYKI